MKHLWFVLFDTHVNREANCWLTTNRKSVAMLYKEISKYLASNRAKNDGHSKQSTVDSIKYEGTLDN
jgi:hypothetical protein